MFRKQHAFWLVPIMTSLFSLMGCATHKESHTARTGVEQLLISSAIDQSLNQVDLSPLAGRDVFLETKYLDCVDKNYVIVSLHHRLLYTGAKLVDKPTDADVILEITSGGVGTDGQELFVGIPEIPLPPPSPVSIPKMALIKRNRLNGTAKLLILAYDARTKKPVIQSGIALARSDQNHWNLLGTGTITTGSVPAEIHEATGNVDLESGNIGALVKRAILPRPKKKKPGVSPSPVRTVSHEEKK